MMTSWDVAGSHVHQDPGLSGALTNSSVAQFAKFEHGRIVRGIAATSRFFSTTILSAKEI